MLPYNPRPRMLAVEFGMETDFGWWSLVGDVHTMEERFQPGRREDIDHKKRRWFERCGAIVWSREREP